MLAAFGALQFLLHIPTCLHSRWTNKIYLLSLRSTFLRSAAFRLVSAQFGCTMSASGRRVELPKSVARWSTAKMLNAICELIYTLDYEFTLRNYFMFDLTSCLVDKDFSPRWQRLLGQWLYISQTEFSSPVQCCKASKWSAGTSFKPPSGRFISTKKFAFLERGLLNVFLCRVMNYLRSFINHVTKTCQKLFHALGSYFNCPRKLLYLWTSSSNCSLMFYCFCCSG